MIASLRKSSLKNNRFKPKLPSPGIAAGTPPVTEPPAQPTTPQTTQKSGPKVSRRSITLSSTSVRMSFKAERPFFPYREPAGQRQEPAGKSFRSLRVFVAANQRMAGKLGDGKNSWPGQTVWADAVPEDTRIGVLGKAKLAVEMGPSKWRLTEFEDRSSPRPGTDEVYFESAADQSAVARPPIVVTDTVRVRVYPPWFGPVAVAGPLGLLVVGLLLIRWVRR